MLRFITGIVLGLFQSIVFNNIQHNDHRSCCEIYFQYRWRCTLGSSPASGHFFSSAQCCGDNAVLGMRLSDGKRQVLAVLIETIWGMHRFSVTIPSSVNSETIQTQIRGPKQQPYRNACSKHTFLYHTLWCDGVMHHTSVMHHTRVSMHYHHP